MTTSKRVLTKWRKEALIAKKRVINPLDGGDENIVEWANRILQLTQELLDQQLIDEVDKDN